jgi:hypothetical protein
MKVLVRFIRTIFIAEAGPIVLTLITFVVTFDLWGPGLLLFGLAIIMVPLAGVGALIIAYLLKKSSAIKIIFYTSLFTTLIGVSLIGYQLYVSTPEKLKVAMVKPDLRGKLTASKGQLVYIGFEHEIYLELQSTPELTKMFLKGDPYELLQIEPEYKFPYGPEWFPKKIKPGYQMYQFDDFETKEKFTAIVTNDLKTIYGMYLDY